LQCQKLVSPDHTEKKQVSKNTLKEYQGAGNEKVTSIGFSLRVCLHGKVSDRSDKRQRWDGYHLLAESLSVDNGDEECRGLK